jgi:uncharacterized repeat protein (TIGR01451 family)
MSLRRKASAFLGCLLLCGAGWFAGGAPGATTTGTTTMAAVSTTTTTTTTTASTTTAGPELVVSTGVAPATGVSVGSTVTFTVTVQNTGSDPVDATVVDTLPAGVALIDVEEDQGGACSGADSFTCTATALAAGTTATIALVVQVTQPGVLDDEVDASASDPSVTVVVDDVPAVSAAAGEAPVSYPATTTTTAS